MKEESFVDNYRGRKNKKLGGKMIDITILDLWYAMKKKIGYILLSAVIFGGASFVYSKFLVQEKFTSSAQMMVNIPGETIDTQLNNAQIQANSRLITTYADIIRGDAVLDVAKKEAGINVSNKKIRDMIDVSSNRESQVFTLEVTTTDPTESVKLANAITTAFEGKLADIYSNAQTFTVLSQPTANYTPVAPNLRNNTIFGILAGLVFSAILFIIRELMNTKVRDEKVLEDLGLVILGSINEMKSKDIDATRLLKNRKNRGEKNELL